MLMVEELRAPHSVELTQASGKQGEVLSNWTEAVLSEKEVNIKIYRINKNTRTWHFGTNSNVYFKRGGTHDIDGHVTLSKVSSCEKNLWYYNIINIKVLIEYIYIFVRWRLNLLHLFWCNFSGSGRPRSGLGGDGVSPLLRILTKKKTLVTNFILWQGRFV
jgi:hypothetical protein